MDKKWVIGIVSSIIIIPILTFGWKNVQAVWASPEKLEKVEAKVDKAETAQEAISRLLLEQQARMDKNEAVYQANLESTKEQLALIADLKRKK